MVGLCSAAVFWIFQSIVDVVLFHEGSLVEQILTPGLHDIWMRTLVICTLIMFGVYAQSIIAERRQAEEARRQSTELAQAVLSGAGTGIYIVQEGKFQYVNSLFQQLTGYTQEELLGTRSLNFVHPEDRQMVRKKAIESLKGQQSPLSYEYRFIKKDGDILRVLERVTSTEYRGERAVVGSFMDITERKQAEEALSQSEERYRTILEEMEDAYFETDLAGNFTFCNGAMCRHTGYSGEDIMGTNFRVLTAQEDVQHVYQAISQVYRTGKPMVGICWKAVRRNGSVGYAEGSFSPLKNEEGRVIGFRCVARDVTEPKRLEQKIIRFNAVLKVLKDIDLLVADEMDREVLINYSCNLIIQAGNYSHVWILLLDDIGGFLSMATAGDTEKLSLLTGRMRQGDYPRCVEELLRSEEPSVMYDKPGSQHGECPLSSAYGANIAFVARLESRGKVYGVLGVSVSPQMATDEDEWALFHEVAGDISYALALIDMDEERRSLEREIRESEEKYRLLADNVSDVIWTLDMDLRFTYVSPSVMRQRGYSVEEAMAQSLEETMTPASFELATKTFADQLVLENSQERDPNRSRTLELEQYCKDGSTIWSEVTVNWLRDRDDGAIGMLGITRDISERKRMEQQLKDMATHDALTGLPNRRLFTDRLNVALAQAQRNHRPLAVLMLDLDKFKDVNDTLGHNVGDQLLKAVGKRLVDCLRSSDTVARLGGDEFILLLPEITSVEDGPVVAQKILDVFAKPFVLDADELNITTSIGIAAYPRDAEDADTLIKNADMAMYAAKHQGRNSYQLWPTEQEALAKK